MTAATRKGHATRERLLDAGIELMRAGGLGSAGINEIVKASGAPKGSVYHHFPGGKQQVVVEAMTLYAARVQAFMRQALVGAPTPGRRLQALFAAFARRLEEGGCTRSCAAGAVCLDLDADLEPVRQAIEAAFATWIDAIADALGFADRQRARSFAGLVLSTIEGAYIRGRAERSGRPFIEAAHWLAPLADDEAAAR